VQWLLRASILGGERAIRLAVHCSLAEVTISYGVTMGVRHPDGASCRIPAPATWDGPALTVTQEAHGRALQAAVRHAAAAEALRVVEAETLATRYRLRAVRDRWIPRLEQAVAEVTRPGGAGTRGPRPAAPGRQVVLNPGLPARRKAVLRPYRPGCIPGIAGRPAQS
jgi:hypothetical protein